MDFNSVTGVITTEALLELERLQREGEASRLAHEHNMEVSEVRWLANLVLEHALASISGKRSLIAGEDAMRMSMRDFLLQKNYDIRVGVPGKDDLIHSLAENGSVHATAVPRQRERENVNSDLLIGRRGQRLELKVATVAGSTNYVKKTVFEDLAYLQRGFGDFPESFPWEGMWKSDRAAELVIFAADKSIALRSKRIAELWGDISRTERVEKMGHDGVTYICVTGKFQPTQTLTLFSKGAETTSKEFVVLAAIPSPR